MQPIQRSARDPEMLLGSRTSRHVYYAEDEDDEDDEDDEADENDESDEDNEGNEGDEPDGNDEGDEDDEGDEGHLRGVGRPMEHRLPREQPGDRHPVEATGELLAVPDLHAVGPAETVQPTVGGGDLRGLEAGDQAQRQRDVAAGDARGERA